MAVRTMRNDPTPGFPMYADFYVDAASIVLEVNLARVAFFLRQDFKYSLGLGTNLLGRGWRMNSSPMMTIGMLFR